MSYCLVKRYNVFGAYEWTSYFSDLAILVMSCLWCLYMIYVEHEMSYVHSTVTMCLKG